MSQLIFEHLASELQVSTNQVAAATKLLDEGATVPFIARYRKEATQGLDDVQLRKLEQRLSYLRELEARKQVICKSIDEQGKLTTELQSAIISCTSKTELGNFTFHTNLNVVPKVKLPKSRVLDH